MSDHPNVLVVCTDHWPGRLFGHRGNDQILTPTLDELAHSGTVFDRCYSECPVCMPARRTLMTGTSPRTHGDRQMQGRLRMPALPTLAQTFRDAGYQAQAVGKLHVYPQRSRIGFDDVQLSEEGRVQHGVVDDYEAFLARRGYPGQYMAHCMSNNQYHVNAWHLPEDCHPTNWATQEMCRQIKRRDPERPGFWYLSYVHPHPPLAPLQRYLDLYRDVELPQPIRGDWSAVDFEALPPALRSRRLDGDRYYNDKRAGGLALQAFYALCTHIDHQLRLVLGTLREEGLLDETIILFTADHGDMLGDHGLWAKRLFYEPSANVPMLLVAPGQPRVGRNLTDGRLVGLQDVMPTLLDLAGLAVPDSCDGLSMVGDQRRARLYGEWGEGVPGATRMLHDGRHKLIWYPVGNRLQLFDLERDPLECTDRSGDPDYAAVKEGLLRDLVAELYGSDREFLHDGELVGAPDPGWQEPPGHPGLSGQRGTHFPMPPGIA